MKECDEIKPFFVAFVNAIARGMIRLALYCKR